MISHLSVSQLDMFNRCGEQWRRRYIEQEIIPPGIAARVGTGVHRAAEIHNRTKAKTGNDMPLDAVLDCAAEAYGKALQDGVYIAPDEVSGARIAMAEGKDSAVRLASVWHKEVGTRIMPALVEEKIVIELPGVDLPIITILDCFTADKTLRDTKTSSRRWTTDKAHTSMQATAYRESVKVATGDYPEKIIFDVLVNNATPVLQLVETERSEMDTAILSRRFRTMLASIRAGIFMPAEPDSWICSPKFCGYWHSCPYIPAHKKFARSL